MEDLALLADPLLTLRPLSGLIVLDEVQLRPEIFATLRVLADEPRPRRRFLVLGRASPELLRQSSETLAGRIAYHELGGFGVEEVGAANADRLWRRGGFPGSYLGRTEVESRRWREELIRTYLERDLPSLGLRLPAPALRRFWMMLAHYHAQVWNASELARAFAVAHTTVQRYLDVLTATFMVRQLQSWHENLGKRVAVAASDSLSRPRMPRITPWSSVNNFQGMKLMPRAVLRPSARGSGGSQPSVLECAPHIHRKTHQARRIDIAFGAGGGGLFCARTSAANGSDRIS